MFAQFADAFDTSICELRALGEYEVPKFRRRGHDACDCIVRKEGARGKVEDAEMLRDTIEAKGSHDIRDHSSLCDGKGLDFDLPPVGLRQNECVWSLRYGGRVCRESKIGELDALG